MGFVLLRLVGSLTLENMLMGRKTFFICNADVENLYMISLVGVAVCVEYL